jgi:hypothetical protein
MGEPESSPGHARLPLSEPDSRCGFPGDDLPVDNTDPPVDNTDPPVDGALPGADAADNTDPPAEIPLFWGEFSAEESPQNAAAALQESIVSGGMPNPYPLRPWFRVWGLGFGV